MSRKSLFSTCAALVTPMLVAAVTAAQGVPSSTTEIVSANGRYRELQHKLAQGWNTWDVNSMTTYVLLPEALAIHVGFLNNGNDFGHQFLSTANVAPGTAFPGPHSWDGSYTEVKVTWQGHEWRVESAHDGADLVLLVTPLDPPDKFYVPATVAFQVDFLWDRPGTALKRGDKRHSRSTAGGLSYVDRKDGFRQHYRGRS